MIDPTDRTAGAAHRDDDADERERLADERERLADERERLADERERLADQQERDADRLTADDGEAPESAREQLLRAEARVQRALAEQERARAALERASLRAERDRAKTEREQVVKVARDLTDDDLAWALERQAFVADARELLADERDDAADARDGRAHEREREADARDRTARAREQIMSQQLADATGAASRLDLPTERARRELASVRDAARRQRASASDARQRAAAERADWDRKHSELGSDSYGRYLTGQLTELTRELFVSQDLFAVARRVVELSVACIPNTVASGAVLLEGVRPIAHVATDDIAEQLDAYQIVAEASPLADALESGEPIVVPDLSRETRWPSFRDIALELGVRGIATCGLAVRRPDDWQALGTLTVYAEEPDVFDDEVGDSVGLFAAHLAVVAAFDRDRHDVNRREAALHRALGSRDVIGQAKGILMERRHIAAGEAFDILRRTSQRLNIRLQELATRLTETGELPEVGT